MKAYKATRVDGTDFRTGTIQYGIVGSTVKHPSKEARIPNRAETYLSCSTVPGETLIGGSWPCRLFEVEISSSAFKGLDASPYKRAVKSMKIVREIEAWRALGPNGLQVIRFLDRVTACTPDEATQLGAAWDAPWSAARGAACAAVRDAARGAACAAAWGAARDATLAAAWGAVRGAVWDAVRDAVRDAAVCDAVWGVTVFDLLTEDQFVALAGPWMTVMGDPR